jgi:predicted transcriptional regulator
MFAISTLIAFEINVSADMSNQTITIRTESDTVDKIGAIAQAMDRSRNWVIEDALRQYIDHQAWYLEGIEQAQESLKAGKGIPHEEVMAEISELINERIGIYEDNQ